MSLSLFNLFSPFFPFTQLQTDKKQIRLVVVVPSYVEQEAGCHTAVTYIDLTLSRVHVV